MMMYFEMVLEMALACGAVYECSDCYHISCDCDGSVDFSQFDADALGAIVSALDYDVVACHESYDGLLCELLQMVCEDFDEWELGFYGVVDGQEYSFVCDCAD